MNKKQKKMLLRIIITSVMLAVLFILPIDGVLKLVCYLAAYLVIGIDILKKACLGIINRRLLDESFLMSIATIGAFVLAIVSKSGDYVEGIAVMLFYQIGELFQSYAVGKSRKSIAGLMDLRPDYAVVESEKTLKRVSPDSVAPGSIIVVAPGERVPLDGIVVEGSSTLNTSALTGESLPRDVAVGDEIISGCININGALKIKTTKPFEESTVSKILELVENASSRKSKSEAFISRFARIYTPAVCIAAILLAVLPVSVRIIMGQSADFGIWLYRALTFLVVSCPCALVISIPLSFFAGIGGASRQGILVKGSNYLEALSSTAYVVFDKTGTLTKGTFEISEINCNGISQERLIEYAALAECTSSHPISKSIHAFYGKELDHTRVSDIEEIGGCGVVATVDGSKVAVGNSKLMKRLDIPFDTCESYGSVVYVAIDGKYSGCLVISDMPKSSSAAAISMLKKTGIKKTVMLTGDAKSVADKIGSELGIDLSISELLPGGKVDALEKLIADKSPSEAVAFVGDGINDAPVLTRADIGIAMGAMGSDAAIEAADVVLMDDDPLKLVKAIKISRKCIGIVKQNIVFALAIKFLCLALAAIGIANMWLAIFADVGVMIIAVLNAIRALNASKL